MKIARKTATAVNRELKKWHKDRIEVRFDSPAGLPGERFRNVRPIFTPSRGGQAVGVRAFGGVWIVRARILTIRTRDGHLAKGSDGRHGRAHIRFHAEHILWLDETPKGSLTPAQIRDEIARKAHAEWYAEQMAKMQTPA